MVISGARRTTLIHLVIENTHVMSCLHNFGHDVFVELGMSLDTNDLSWLIEALNSARGAESKVLATLWCFENNVSVHLVEVLANVSPGFIRTAERGLTSVSCPKTSFPVSVRVIGSTEISHPSLRPTLAPSARARI